MVVLKDIAAVVDIVFEYAESLNLRGYGRKYWCAYSVYNFCIALDLVFQTLQKVYVGVMWFTFRVW